MTSRKPKKQKSVFVCQNCGYESPRWLGKCPSCGAWNSFLEEKVEPVSETHYQGLEKSEPMPITQVNAEQRNRILTKSREFDRVLGGGIVPGSIVLLSGDPGIGKSTLLLQRAAEIAESGIKTLYVSAEESLQQTKMRANRLAIGTANLLIYSEIDLSAILAAVNQTKPGFLIVDSIQSIYSSNLESAPGSVSQVRECALQLLHLAKAKNLPVFLVGHVTKEGVLAGPRVLEHMVDALLYLEGERQYQYRILRTVKNRFGSTNELGVFEMQENGLRDVKNPSELFLTAHQGNLSGLSVTCTMEGTRPILVEIQALTAQSGFGYPQRTATGIDQRRLSLLLAVLEKRAGLRVGTHDVFVKVAGGLRIDDPTADLATSLSVASSFLDRALSPKTVVLGEVGLGGDIRPVSQLDRRIHEAERLGFEKVVAPKFALQKLKKSFKIKLVGVERISEAIEASLL